ncbi:Spc97/Spc98 family protein [Truncatella angustata]|uniref:Spindle pole body component n=1 Tax=Truncatella angustata TaxID=152316 RepID=A0A9P8UMN9_9PEZI|nr:Spc97/Spc98 family protein [Truncatella angustata]KAH6655023.1 Spc97/Spc98 family protein [Truncatella angustata]KAH8196106.1 hypothetical protein TruAng_009733 [Truncatella angustata]
MAHAATLSALTEELIQLIIAETSPEKSRALKDTSLHSLRHHNYLRTNQFDVENQFNGLEERFRVLGRDGLADALRDNLDALPNLSNKFTPDALHFLLELADQPVQKTKLETLELLRQTDCDPTLGLEWEETADDDDLDTDPSLWRSVDFRDDSSEDTSLENQSNASLGSEDTSLSSTQPQHSRRPADLVVETQDILRLDQVRDSQSWRPTSSDLPLEESDKTIISELQAVREVLFMLRGLPNDLFNSDYRPAVRCKLQHASWKSFQVLLNALGESGRDIYVLRRFVQKDQQIPLLQVFRNAVQERLRQLDNRISAIEISLVDITVDTVVSLVKVAEQLRTHLQALRSLSRVVRQLERENYPHAFRYLELLFDSAGIAQLEGDDVLYKFLGTVFFQCFEVYLRPIRQWMQNGDILAGDRTFFIAEVQPGLPLSQIWEGQFALRKSVSGVLHAPDFLQPTAEKIFRTGKSVVLLKHLGIYVMDDAPNTVTEPLVDFEGLVATSIGTFTPFPELFNSVFEAWMQSKHHSASTRLRQVLFDRYGLWSSLSDIHHIYLMADGSRMDEFSHALFSNLDLLNVNWHDRFLLTQSFQDAFGPVVAAHCVVISAVGKDEEDITLARTSVRKCLPMVTVNYRMPWPIRIIVSDESMAHYQAVFTLLLQLNRASQMIQKRRLIIDGLYDLTSGEALYYGLRSRLLWFLTSLKSYVSTLVIAPLVTQLREGMRISEDVDAMALVHSTFVKRIRDAACLGSKLDPIRESMLEIMDLAIRLEDARHAEAVRHKETQEISRLSVSAPLGTSKGMSERYTSVSDEEDHSFLEEREKYVPAPVNVMYEDTLSEIQRHFDRQLRFICGGLRGAARASKDVVAGHWDMLAEILEVGVEQSSW